MRDQPRAEIEALAAEYGEPLRRVVDVGPRLFDPLSKNDRVGEVCMVIRRRNGRVLTAIKTFYPRGAYRLLTGGIGHGERIRDALAREVREETGLEARLERFLALLTYRCDGKPVFHTYAFLLEERGGSLASADPDEQLEEFREIEVDELPALARTLASLGDRDDDAIGGSWRDWGRFRAAVHDAVWEALRGPRFRRSGGACC